jgi:hypothetical protein
MTQSPLTQRRWFADPTPVDIDGFNRLVRQRQRYMLVASGLLGLAIITLGVVVWRKLPVLGLMLGINLLLVFTVGILDQLWRRCPRCDYSLVPNIVQMEVDDSRSCPRCELNLDLLTPPPI